MSEHDTATVRPSDAAVRAQLERTLASGAFAGAPVLSRFLAHVVEHALRDDPVPLKEFAIGVEVFDRDADYDPRTDTIVRVQARRLRARLDAYYETDGRRDAIRFEIAKGQYGVEISTVDPARRASAGSTIAANPGASLPFPRNALIGREHETEVLMRELGSDAVRLLTLTGVGGSGKTRLALEVAHGMADAFPGGVVFIDLSAVSDRSALAGAVADAFDVKISGGQPLPDAIAARLRSSLNAPVLLVLDNFEGVLDGGDLVGSLLDASAALTVLVTSRVALQVYGEHEYPLPPLAIPEAAHYDDPAALSEVASVRLFLARARAANPHRELDAEQLSRLGELCARLDGLPLAIELVAAQARTLSPADMLRRFSGHLDLPANPARDAPSRQRTLRRAIDWSHELLDEPARKLLRRASVFAGGFTLEGAEAVADAPQDIGPLLMSALDALVSLGLVYRRRDDGEPRYAMLETLRAYGHERLLASGEADAIRLAHAAYCLVLAEEGVPLQEPGQRSAWLARCDLEQDNFRAAIGHLIQFGRHEWSLRMGQALYLYWERREKLADASRLLRRIVEAVPPAAAPALWGKVSSYAAAMAAYEGGHTEALASFHRLLDLSRRIGDRKGEAALVNALGVCARFVGDEEGAANWFAEAADLCRAFGDRRETAAALSNLAQCRTALGETGAARALLEESRAMFLAVDDALAAAWCLNHLADVARLERRLDDADALYRSAQDSFERLGDRWGLARTLADRGRLALLLGETRAAGDLLADALSAFIALRHQRGMAAVTESLAEFALVIDEPGLAIQFAYAADAWRRSIGFSARPNDRIAHDRTLSLARAQVKRSGIAALKAIGERMTPAAVLNDVRGRLHARSARSRKAARS